MLINQIAMSRNGFSAMHPPPSRTRTHSDSVNQTPQLCRSKAPSRPRCQHTSQSAAQPGADATCLTAARPEFRAGSWAPATLGLTLEQPQEAAGRSRQTWGGAGRAADNTDLAAAGGAFTHLACGVAHVVRPAYGSAGDSPEPGRRAPFRSCPAV